MWVVEKLVGCGGGTTTSGNVVETYIWLNTWAVTPIDTEVLAPPIVNSVGCSSTFGALF